MDSEHRHELEENVLAKWLSEKLEAVAPHATTILAALLAAVAAGVGWSAYSATSTASRADAWRSYTLAMEGSAPSLNALRLAADENPGTPVEEWALITLADGRVWEAANKYFRDKRAAEEDLVEAEDLYRSLLSAAEPGIGDRAAYGLGRVYEMRGDTEEARSYYDQVTGPFSALAARRSEELDSPQAKESYAWLTGAETASDDAAEAETDLADPDASLDALLESLGDSDDESEDAPDDE